jgi:hypothetical protein
VFFFPSPGGTLRTRDVVALFNQVDELGHQTSSLIATRGYAFLVEHAVVDWSTGLLLSRIREIGTPADVFELSWRAYLAQEQVSAADVERHLCARLAPDRVLVLPSLKRYKVETSSFSCGFYWKPAGAWTWSGVALRSSAAAELLRDFFAGAPPPAPAPGAPQLAAGAIVAVTWQDGRCYRATVLGQARDGYYVAFDDGRPQWVPAHFVRPAPP